MARNIYTASIYLFSIVFLFSVYHHLIPSYDEEIVSSPASAAAVINPYLSGGSDRHSNQLIHEEQITDQQNRVTAVIPNFSDIDDQRDSPRRSESAVSILFPDWEVLVIVTAAESSFASGERFCLFENKETSPARPDRDLPSPYRKTFRCEVPPRIRRRFPFRQPILTAAPKDVIPPSSASPLMLRWNYVVYDALAAEDDVVLFVKGIINRQGGNRDPTEFRCVFGDDAVNGVRTAVTSSSQEVFRCKRPELTAANVIHQPIRVSLEIVQENHVVPSVAYYTHTPPSQRKVARKEEKFQLCACTMVYNVAKFLREWVVYHSKIGVEKFIIYDNGSDDDFQIVVDQLVSEGYNVETVFWLWPKTQEAGFSHSAVHANDSCKWMMYIDVDEFVYSPNWSHSNSSGLSKSLLQSLLPQNMTQRVGEVMISCHEFGPSNQEKHPITGVTQGYNCRKRMENRHKSIVLLDAVHDSLLNVIHHFTLKPEYKARKLNIQHVIVNHYKYQAWSEFKAKFRRRVSAFVVDWTKAVNPMSKDRTPGLGFDAVEPKGWTNKFCEVYDNGLRDWTRRWFGVRDSQSSGFRMAWQ